MKLCSFCGAKNPDTASRCFFCGAELESNQDPAARPEDLGEPALLPEQSPEPSLLPGENKENNRRGRGAVLTFSFAAAILALTAILVLGSSLFESARLYRWFGRAQQAYANYHEPVEEEDVLEEDGVDYVGDQLLVVSAPGLRYEEMERYFRQQDMEIVGYVELIDAYQLRLDRSRTLAELVQLARRMEEDPFVDAAAVNAVREKTGFMASGDPWGGRCDWTQAAAHRDNWGVMAIRAPQSWERWEPEEVRVGVIDSYFDPENPDLSYAVLKYNEISPSRIKEEDKIHGTHVAGTIGAIHNNGIGTAGVAENCVIYGYSALRFSSVLDEVSAIAELSSRGVRVINYSMGLDPGIRDKAMERSGMEREIYYTGSAAFAQTALGRLLSKGYDFLLVCSAGNDPVDAVWASEYTYITEPEILDRILVVGAAGIDGDGSLYQPAWSAMGARVDLLAPGVDIYSLVPGGGDYMTGASMAAPHAAGVCASVWAVAPGLSGAELKSLVLRTADIPVADGQADLVNMYAAMAAAEQNGNRS